MKNFGIELGVSLLIPKIFHKCERFTLEQTEKPKDEFSHLHISALTTLTRPLLSAGQVP